MLQSSSKQKQQNGLGPTRILAFWLRELTDTYLGQFQVSEGRFEDVTIVRRPYIRLMADFIASVRKRETTDLIRR